MVEISASLEDLYVGNTMKVNLSFWLNIVTSLIIFCHDLDSQRLYLDRFGETFSLDDYLCDKEQSISPNDIIKGETRAGPIVTEALFCSVTDIIWI